MHAGRIGDDPNGIPCFCIEDIHLGAVRNIDLLIGSDRDIIPAAGAADLEWFWSHGSRWCLAQTASCTGQTGQRKKKEG